MLRSLRAGLLGWQLSSRALKAWHTGRREVPRPGCSLSQPVGTLCRPTCLGEQTACGREEGPFSCYPTWTTTKNPRCSEKETWNSPS